MTTERPADTTVQNPVQLSSQVLPGPEGLAPANGPSPALRAALAATTWVRLEVRHRVMADLQCQAFKGPLWRSVLGQQLEAVNPDAAQALHAGGQTHGRAAPVWCLAGPTNTATEIPAGTLLDSAVTLFGTAARWWPDCLSALRSFEQAGLGHAGERVPLRLVDARVRTPAGLRPPGAADMHSRASDIFDAAQSESAALGPAGVEISFISPLHLIDGNRAVQQAPTLAQCLQRLLARLRALAPADLPLGLAANGELAALQAWALTVPLADSAIHPVRMAHYSARQQGAYPLLGITGYAAHAAPAALALPWLRLGEWLQLGKGTHFGQGVIAVSAGRPLVG